MNGLAYLHEISFLASSSSIIIKIKVENSSVNNHQLQPFVGRKQSRSRGYTCVQILLKTGTDHCVLLKFNQYDTRYSDIRPLHSSGRLVSRKRVYIIHAQTRELKKLSRLPRKCLTFTRADWRVEICLPAQT